MKTRYLPALLALLALIIPPLHAESESESVTCGWYHWDPYQYLDETRNLNGLDVALLKTIFTDSQINVLYDADAQDNWKKNQADVLAGTKDLTAGAFDTPERQQKYHLSKPYRHEWNTLYVRTAALTEFKADSIQELISTIKQGNYRLGVIDGYKYTSDELNTFISEQQNLSNSLVISSSSDERSFENLAFDKVDIIASDRLVGARILWQKKLGSIISEHPVKLPEKPIHVLFHRSNDPERDREMQQLRNQFNSSVDKLTANGTISSIIGDYLFPVLMNISVQRPWFYMIDLIGAVFFALAGLLIARDQRFDIFGTVVLVALLSTGGGAVRDLLVGRPLCLLSSSSYAYIVLSVSALGFLLCRLHTALCSASTRYRNRADKDQRKWQLLREIIEAIALGAYTIIGVGVAVEMKIAPLWLWGPVLGCVTSCGGGVMAIALRGGEEVDTMRGAVTPESSLIWGFFLSQFLIWQTNRLNPDEVFIGIITTLIGAALTILISKKLNIHSPCMTRLQPALSNISSSTLNQTKEDHVQ